MNIIFDHAAELLYWPMRHCQAAMRHKELVNLPFLRSRRYTTLCELKSVGVANGVSAFASLAISKDSTLHWRIERLSERGTKRVIRVCKIF